MAAVTHRISTASTANANSYASGSFTPAANELLVVFVTASGTVEASPTVTDSQGLNFSLVTSGLYGTGSTMFCFVAVKLAANSAMTVTFNCPNDAATGAVVQVAGVSGMTRVGTGAIKQSQIVANHASGTPAPVFSNSALTGNPTLGLVANSTNPATMTTPTNWTERNDTGYATPTTGAEYVSRDSGFTGTTVTWGSSSASIYGAMIIEMDTSAPAATATLTDDFPGSSLDVTKWVASINGGTVTVGSGVLTITNPNSTAFTGQLITSLIDYDLTGSYLVVNVEQVGNTATDEDTNVYVVVGSDFNYRLMFTQENGNLKARKVIAGTFTDVASVTYNATTMAWWRIRESGGTIFWDYSADGKSWTNLTSLTNPFGITTVTIDIEVFEQTSIASPGSGIFDNVNLLTPYTKSLVLSQAVNRASTF